MPLPRNGSAESKQSCMWRTFEPRPWTLRIGALKNLRVRAQFKMESGVSAGWTSVGQRFCGHQNPGAVWTFIGWPTWLVHHRGKTVTKPLPLSRLGLPLSEKQIPQVVENLESGGKPKEALERVAMRPRQVRYQAALGPTCYVLILKYLADLCNRPEPPGQVPAPDAHLLFRQSIFLRLLQVLEGSLALRGRL